MPWSPEPVNRLVYSIKELCRCGEESWDGKLILDDPYDQLNHKGPHKKEARGSKLEREDVNMEAVVTEERRCYCVWIWRKGPQADKCRQVLEAEKAME